MNDNTEMSMERFLTLPADSYILIDTRDEEAYKQGHIDGAVYSHSGEGNYQGLKLIFYCQYGVQSIETAEVFRRCGYEAYSLEGGYLGWLKKQSDAFDMEELERYDRQITLPQIGTQGQEKLKNSSVLIVGAGGLGCPCGMYLASAGVGRIGIIDHDEVSLSNMNRQVAHRKLGINKAESLKDTLGAINDKIKITAYPYRLDAENAAGILEGYDFVIDCTDRAETKFMLNDICVRYGKPYCYGGVIGFQGQVMTVIPHKTACLRCIFEAPPESCDTCESLGIIGAAAGIMGCIQALEAIKYITSAGDILTNKMFIFDMLTMKTRTAAVRGINPECSVCNT